MQLLRAKIQGCAERNSLLPPDFSPQGKAIAAKRAWFCVTFFPPLPHSLSSLFTAAATGNLLDLEDPAKLLLTSSENPTHLDNSMFGPSSSVNNNVVWVSLPRAPQNLLSWQGVMLPQSLCAPGPLLVLFLGQDPLRALGQLSCSLRISDLPKRAGFWCPTRNGCLLCEYLQPFPGLVNKLKQLQATVRKCYCQIIEYYLILHSASQWFVT